MADSSSAQERTERATPKRRREARKRGQVPRSRELAGATVVAAGLAAVFGGATQLAAGARNLLASALHLDASMLTQPERMPALFAQAASRGMLLFAPLFAATLGAALFAPVLLGGWNFSAGALKPDFSRINPMSGLARMFSGHGAVELGKSLLKVGCIGAVGAIYLWHHRFFLMALAAEPVEHAIGDGSHLIFGVSIWLVGVLVAIAAIDAPYQLWSHAKQLRMTKQEIRDEYKESEGRPEVKGRIRRLQREMSQRRMMENVENADVVVTNPTHYAVALQYKSGGMRAPRVVAKGAGEIAVAIRERARTHRVPLLSAPPLARALYRSVELDQEIPIALYAAVARVLTYVYQLRTAPSWQRPPPPDIGNVPGGEADT